MNLSKTLSDSILEFSPTPTAWFSKELNFIGANKKFLELFILADRKLNGEHFSDVFDSYEFNSFMGQFLKGNETGVEYKHAMLVDRKLGQFKFKIEKNADLVILCAEDITDLFIKEQEMEALRSKTMEGQRMAILGEMTAGIAHEINNPITVIISHADQLKSAFVLGKPTNQEEIVKRLDRIISTCYRIDKIIGGLRTFSRDGSKDPFQTTLISNLISESIELCTEKLKNHQINLIIDQIEPGLELECRPGQIAQILLNLIGNAKDAISELDERWIRIQVKDLGDSIRFALTDSGSGIPKEIESKLTTAFFTTKPQGKGTGLGLAITKAIVESHYGEFFIDRDCPNTKFVFDIPKGLSAVI